MENKDILKDFFEGYKVEQPKNEVEETNPSVIENDFLFSNPLSDVDAFIKLEELKIKSRLETEKVKSLRNDRKLRKNNANKAFCFAITWAFFVCLFITFYSFSWLGFKISETVFMFVCGTLTTSILIFYLTVIRNLFPTSRE